jgi:hypothetical protein
MRWIAAVVGGLVAWFVVAQLGDFVLRALLPGYADLEQAMLFTLGMQTGRLVVGALASLIAGWVAALIARNGRAGWALALALILLFVPVHYQLWDRFPLWYHLVFLASLIVVTPAGAALVRRRHA